MNAGTRLILCLDLDAFFASVEELRHPEWRGLPLVVGGKPEERGVVASCSYAARAFGVRSAMPTAEAQRLCPSLVLLPPDFERYTAVSREIMSIFRNYTPLVEPLSLDEAFLDVAGCERLFGDGEAIGHAIKADILARTGLVASVGVAPSKFLAKLASDLEKPDGFRVIRQEEIRTVLDPLPVSRIYGVGPRTARRLELLGVQTVGDLARRDRTEVVREFGASGLWIHELAHGVDPRRVTPRREEKSHGMERTFPKDISNREELRLFLLSFCEEVAYGLRDRGLRGKTVTLKARFADFTTITRTKTLPAPTNLGPRIYAAARELLDRVPEGPLRLIGVSLSGLQDVRAPVQERLFHGEEASRDDRNAGFDARRRLERATEGLDRLRRKFGRTVVLPASLVGRDRLRGRDGSEGRVRLTGAPATARDAREPKSAPGGA